MPFFNMTKNELAQTLDGKGEWGPFFVKTIVLLVAISTLSFSISTVDSLASQFEALFTGVEYFCVAVFTVEYILRLYVADNKIYYIFQPLAIVDLVSILPSWIDIVIPGDEFPALQFLRMLRLFKFLSTSDRGSAASNAFKQSWDENLPLIIAASFAGGAVWIATASLQYLAERDNKDMLWCYPPVSPNDNESTHPERALKSIKCVCDDESCEGADCECVERFGSIPSAMFFVLLNLSGEFPLADSHSTMGRFVCVATAVISVGIFAIPTGLIGAALEDSVSALNSGAEDDYDCDEDDAAEIAAEANQAIKAADEGRRVVTSNKSEDMMSAVEVPPFTLTKRYKQVCGIVICSSAVVAVLSTVRSMPQTGIFLFYAVDILCALFFCVEHIARVLYAGPEATCKTMFSSLLPAADLISWLPTMIYVFGGVVRCPAYLFLTVALFRMMKYERYSHGFQILNKVLVKSQGILAVGGMAAAVVLVFCSALMYYAERNNPDPNMSKYYSSVPTAMWITLLNLSGEAPLCDYTLAGRFIVGFLSIVAVAIFGVPVGALGAGFEEVITELASGGAEADEDEGEGAADEEGKRLLSGEEGEGISMTEIAGKPSALGGGGRGGGVTESAPGTYGAVQGAGLKKRAAGSSGEGAAKRSATAPASTISEAEQQQRAQNNSTALQRLVNGQGTRGVAFQTISVLATLFAVALEVVSTCAFATNSQAARDAVFVAETAVVVWFTIEYLIRTGAHGFGYVCSGLGFVDFVSTFPYYLARGLLGQQVALVMDSMDGPLRALRLLRLLRLDTYAPSISLVDDAFRECWSGLWVAIYAGLVLWFFFNELLYFAERDDEEGGESKRFRSALSSLQYSGVLLTGDYPIKDFTIWGQLCCAAAVVVAVGIVAVPASILSGAFVDILQNQAEARRKERYDAAVKCQRLFLSRKRAKEDTLSKGGSAFQAVVRDAITHSAVLRGLDSSDPPFLAKLCLWKNGKSSSAALFHTCVAWLIGFNILAVVLESMPAVEQAVPHLVWQAFECISVLVFTMEYLMNLLTACYDPRWGFSRWKMATSFIGIADVLAIVPFYLQEVLFPLLAPQFVFDATIFRIFRMARILEFERFFTAFSLLGDVFTKAAPVLKATGVLALIVWVGGATVFYYVEPHSDEDGASAEAAAQGGEDAAVFTSIVDALYYCAIFLAGEWAVVDFTPVGSVVCTVMAIIGVALFSIPVGVLFESFQDMLAEKHARK